jgi:hypothetical protein
MVSFLRTTLCLLVGLVQVSRAVHFTNTEWDVVENETVTFNWKYDSDDTRDPDTYVIVIWLPFGTEVYPWSGIYSHLLYNGTLPLTPFSIPGSSSHGLTNTHISVL